MSYSGWIRAQWILKKTNAAGIAGLFRYLRPQTRDESSSKNAAVQGKKKSPIASDYFRSQKKHTVLRLCLSKASTWIHYPLQTSDAELITACTETLCSSQEVFSFWPQNTLWQVAESHHQRVPAGETEARSHRYFPSASLTCRSTEPRNPNTHSSVWRTFSSTERQFLMQVATVLQKPFWFLRIYYLLSPQTFLH